MMLQIAPPSFDERTQAQIARGIVLTEIRRIRADAAAIAPDVEERIGELEDEIDLLKQATRSRDFGRVQPYALAAAERLGVSCPVPLPAEFGCTVAAALRKLRRIEIEVLDEGEDPVHAAWGLLDRHADGELPKFLRISACQTN